MGQIYEGDDFRVIPSGFGETIDPHVDCGMVLIYDKEGHLYHRVEIRTSIAEFAIEMEKEMAKKDKKYGKDSNKYHIRDLLEHLKSERNEVDNELNGLLVELNLDELVHEALMCMMVKHKIKEIIKKCKV